MADRDSLARLAARVMCVGFAGSDSAAAPLNELGELAPAGVILFDRNVTDVDGTAALVAAVARAIGEGSGVAPFVAIDQEGGRVVRLRRGAREIPAMMALGAAADVALAERVGASIAADLRRAGVTVDFAPVLDLATEPLSAVVGTRSFGDDPQRVAALGVAVGRGLERGGVTATFKHFPGHGATAVDSHEALPVIDLQGDPLRRHLAPFADAIAQGARAIMVGHLDVRALDPGVPATVSARVVRGVLRDELGFAGVAFTDCMEMAAIARSIGTARACALAIAAGIDCVLISHTMERAYEARDAIVAAVEAGEIPEERLREAADRVARVQTGGHDHHAVDEGSGARAAREAVTLVRAPAAGVAPLAKNEPVTVISFEGVRGSGAETGARSASLSLALRERGVRSELLRVELEPDAEMLEALVLLTHAQRGRRFVLLARAAVRHERQRAAIEALLTELPGATLVALREPFDAGAFPRAQSVFCTYGDGPIALDALADVLTGRARATGTLPVSLPGT